MMKLSNRVKMIWMSLPIAKKIFLIIGGIVGIVVITTIISTFLFFSVTRTYYQVMKEQDTWFSQQEIKNMIFERMNAVLLYLSTGNEEYRILFEESANSARKIEEYLLERTPDSERMEVERFINKSQDWEFILRNKIIPVYTLGNTEDAWKTMTEDAEPRALALVEAVQTFTDRKEREIRELAYHTIQDGRMVLFIGNILGITTILVAILLGWIFINSMTKPIMKLHRGTRRLAAGNLDYKVPVSGKDELGQLGDAFNRMGQQLKQLIEELNHKNIVLRQESRKAQEANRLKSEFLATISHEFRTPLNGIIGFSEVLQEGYTGPLNAKQQQYVAHILDNGKHLLSLINDVLDLSKIEAGKMQIELSPIEIEPFFSRSLTIIQERAKSQHISLTYLNNSRIKEIWADPIRLRQIMNNLLSNAIKFTPPGGEITLRLDNDGDNLIVSVMDTGIGIQKESLDKIFLPFYQDEGQLDRRFEGTGLGLTLTKRLVHLHGGTITVNSEIGKGSIFTFTIPLVPPNDPTHAGIYSPNEMTNREVASNSRLIWIIGEKRDFLPAMIAELEKEFPVQQMGIDSVEEYWETMEQPPFCVFLVYDKEIAVEEWLKLEWLKWLQNVDVPIFIITDETLSLREKAPLFRMAREIILPEYESVKERIDQLQ